MRVEWTPARKNTELTSLYQLGCSQPRFREAVASPEIFTRAELGYAENKDGPDSGNLGMNVA